VHQLFIDFKKTHVSGSMEVLYNIFSECGSPMELVKLIKLCLSETCSRVWLDKHVDMLPINNGLKNRNALSPLFFNFALEYAIRRIQVIQEGLKLNGTHQLVIYADDVNL
jgi:hypothetical protein